MPVRSLHSSVMRWPSKAEVANALRLWAQRYAQINPHLIRVGYFGSYAREDWGVGSDLDVIAVVETADESREHRAAGSGVERLPVPVDLFIYTRKEWAALTAGTRRFERMVQTETVWVYQRPG